MTTQALNVRIKPDLRQAVVIAATESRRKISAQVEVIIEEWLAAKESAEHKANNGQVALSS